MFYSQKKHIMLLFHTEHCPYYAYIWLALTFRRIVTFLFSRTHRFLSYTPFLVLVIRNTSFYLEIDLCRVKTRCLLLTAALAWVSDNKSYVQGSQKDETGRYQSNKKKQNGSRPLPFWQLHGHLTIDPQFNQLNHHSFGFSNFSSCLSEKGTFLFIKNGMSPSCLLIVMGTLEKRTFRPTEVMSVVMEHSHGWRDCPISTHYYFLLNLKPTPCVLLKEKVWGKAKPRWR